MTAEYRWDINYAFGRQGELLVADKLRQIASGQASIEVKNNRRWNNGKVFIETACYKRASDRYEDSGVTTTQADYYALVLPGASIVLVPTHKIRQVIGNALPQDLPGGANPRIGHWVRLIDLLKDPS